MHGVSRRAVVWIGAFAAIAAGVAIAISVTTPDAVQVAPPISPRPTASSSCATRQETTSTMVTTTTLSPPASLSMQRGTTGAAVEALQTRLLGLGYWLDGAHGAFDDSTVHAVVAFQKAQGLQRDGIVGPLTASALATATRLAPRSRTGHVIEIDLTRQLLLDSRDGHVTWVFDTSTGAVPGTTPSGRWEVYRQVDGYDPSPLGVLYRPKYFHGGVAIHGYPNVPPYPASHGCVRVTNEAIDWLWAHGEVPIGTDVWVY
jgi:N-acetylmuramoyl-L-alanine amidase